ncbi:UDP-glucose--hexose-1-phosphate uridylyltransferase [Massilicoli timonensis]|uniref:UDP-glucose--hexose-1-phosphate uridylyltransferase n=1 Tax=Massilicoli timonensis TaxID=2015901 RepID=UPI00248BB9BB|nr:UDP-glucose--hexose-1-phosphate uridylyltransferase [Massilicoli timonensis]
MDSLIASLLAYGKKHQLYEEADTVYVTNQLLHLLGKESYEEAKPLAMPIETILEKLCDAAVENKRLEDTKRQRDAFDSALMNAMMARPSSIIAHFEALYAKDAKQATDWFYEQSIASHYIRMDRIAKNICYRADTRFGTLDITINLSKPEKDPKDIAAALHAASSTYPKCVICRECEGYYGNVNCDGRSNHRIIPLELDHHRWYLQYSPYVYYNEHCIVLNEAHTPMKITKQTFMNLLSFVKQFPHYFLGSNADLPIVGGSILSHDHYQGGRYTFAMSEAKIMKQYDCFIEQGIETERLYWPLTTLRLKGKQIEALCDAAEVILRTWRSYSDESVGVIAKSDALHNTITPIARQRNGIYELDLVLRNNRTSEAHPLGIFHPHEEIHHIKKENIGLIEVMGLAVLPARLIRELADMERYVLGQPTQGEIGSHIDWLKALMGKHTFTQANAAEILKQEIAEVFAEGLAHCGVFKLDHAGEEACDRFMEQVLQNTTTNTGGRT